jgi:hypothetical protein
VLRSQCLDRRIDNKEQLKTEIATWEHQRNSSGARIKWMFTTDKARTKMGRAYPMLGAISRRPTQRVIITVQRYYTTDSMDRR